MTIIYLRKIVHKDELVTISNLLFTAGLFAWVDNYGNLLVSRVSDHRPAIVPDNIAIELGRLASVEGVGQSAIYN